MPWSGTSLGRPIKPDDVKAVMAQIFEEYPDPAELSGVALSASFAAMSHELLVRYTR
jgi:hypothetical protein